jgi:hypothetical protein
MSELPSAPPPPEEPAPGVQPQYTVPPDSANRWLGRHAMLYGIAAGMVLYLSGYVVTAILSLNQADRPNVQATALTVSFYTGGIATLLVLGTAVVLLIIPRTRAFGSGLVISMAIGVLCGGGVCTALVLASAGR